MVSLAEIDRPIALDRQGQFITIDLPLRASIRTTEEGAIATASQLVETLKRIVELCGGTQEAGEFLIHLAQNVEVVSSGKDHFHRPLYEQGPRREGALVAISRIPERSNRLPKRHKHPMDCLEIIVPLGDGLASLLEVDRRLVRHRIPTLTPFFVPRGVKHSDYNMSHDPVVYVIYRAKLF